MRLHLKQSLMLAALWTTSTIFVQHSLAQTDLSASYPNRPIHIVVSFPPGGNETTMCIVRFG